MCWGLDSVGGGELRGGAFAAPKGPQLGPGTAPDATGPGLEAKGAKGGLRAESAEAREAAHRALRGQIQPAARVLVPVPAGPATRAGASASVACSRLAHQLRHRGPFSVTAAHCFNFLPASSPSQSQSLSPQQAPCTGLQARGSQPPAFPGRFFYTASFPPYTSEGDHY